MSIGILVLCAAAICSADPSDADGVLFVRPDHCLVSDVDAVCNTVVDLTWQLDEKQNVCLSRSDLEKLVQCWQQSRSETLQLEIIADDSFTFLLQEQASGTTLAEHTFQIVTLQPKKRQARRNAWSFF